jgi:hypothetical protein
MLSPDTIHKLDTVIKNHKGTHQVRMQVLDYQNKTSVQLISTKRKVLADTDFVKAIEAIGFECRLNAN